MNGLKLKIRYQRPLRNYRRQEAGKLAQDDKQPNNDGIESGRKYECQPHVRFAPNNDSPREPSTEMSPNTCTLRSVEAAPSSGMDELEAWRNEAINEETQRYKRKLEDSD